MTAEGTVLIIAAVGLALTQVITALRTKDLTVQAVKKLDVVMEQGDGMRTELLDRVAALERMLAAQSGNTIRADNAEQAASDHRAATMAAKEK